MAASEFGGSYNVESFEDSSVAPMRQVEVRTQPVSLPPLPRAAGATAIPALSTPLPPQMPQLKRNALTADQEAVAANFERDLAAMLGTPSPASTPENQQWDNTVRDVTSAPTATSPAPAVVAPNQTPAPKQNGHDVFNQMGLAMNYANSFDLGVMDLSARFDRFDEELALNRKSAATPASAFSSPSSVQALALDDFDLVADLAEISGAQSAPAPSTAVPSTEPCVTKEEATTTTPAPSPVAP
jgi:hypothetical protein